MNGEVQAKKRSRETAELQKSNASKYPRLENSQADVVDLCYDDSDGAPVPPSTTKLPHRQPTTKLGDHTLPTPDPSPIKGSLRSLPELAGRYVPKSSTADGVTYRDPWKFGVKPAYWQRWRNKDFERFAEHLRQQFDPFPFAKETGRPVEEVNHVFRTLVVNPLYDFEEARRRGEKGMEEIFDLYEKHGTPSRRWGKREKGCEEVKGELDRVAVGSVRLILANGSKKTLKLRDLSDDDVKYLQGELIEKDLDTLWTIDATLKK